MRLSVRSAGLQKNTQRFARTLEFGYIMQRLDIINLAEAMSSLDTVQTIRHPNKTLWKWQINHLCVSGIKGFNILSVQIAFDLSS